MDVVSNIIAFESGELQPNEVVDFFAELIRTGLAYSLQGFYGRTAETLIQNGNIDRKGNVLEYLE